MTVASTLINLLAMPDAPQAPTKAEKMPGPLARYRRLLVAVRAERGERCEVCGEPTKAAHHVNAVGLHGIASALTFEPGNLLLVCSHCHTLFHPGRRSYPWTSTRVRRGRALSGLA